MEEEPRRLSAQQAESLRHPREMFDLCVIQRHRFRSWIALILYAAAVTFPHEFVQSIVGAFANKITRPGTYRVFAALALIELAILTWIVARKIAAQPARMLLATFWSITVVLIWATWRFGTANNVELVHYPQYVPEGMLLLALTLSPAESLAWVSLFGGLDEAFQYTFLAGGRKVPLDFNDIYMDVLGGAAGVVLAMALMSSDRRGAKSWRRIVSRPGIIVILSMVVVGVLLWATGAMVLYDEPGTPAHWFALSHVRMPAFWFQVDANGPNKYHTLSPIEGPILILLTIALYSILDRRVNCAPNSPRSSRAD